MAEEIPGAAPNAAPSVYVKINQEWAGILIGLLFPLTNDSYWAGTPTEQRTAVNQAELLQGLLMLPSPEIAFRVQRLGNQVMNPNANMIVTFGNVEYDLTAAYNTTTHEFTAPVMGIYSFHCRILSDGAVNASFFVDNLRRTQSDAPANVTAVLTDVYSLNAGQKVQIRAQTTGATVIGGNGRCSFAGSLLIPL